MRVLALTMIYTLFAKPAFAYIDAALGSLILQGLVAGFFSFMVMWRSWIGKVKSFFTGKPSQGADAAAQIEE